MRRYGNYVEAVSKYKLRKMGFEQYLSYWSDTISQQNIITKLLKDEEYLYTQKRDKTGLFRVIIYVRK